MASTIILTTGVPGSGKSYVRCACFLVDYFLLNSDGMHISNFPVNADAIADEVVRRSNLFKRGIFAKITAPFRRKHHRVTKEEILKRIVVIPEKVLQSWRNEESGPWDYFNGVDLTESHIAIDEIHNFIGASKSPYYINQWDEFLGEVRHRGCTFEGLTQDILSVDPILKNRAGVRMELVPADTLRDPFFHITLSDWYELKASFTGEIKKCVFEREYQMRFSRWACLRTHRFYLNQEYFKFYNSFNASLAEKESGAVDDKNRTPKYEFQRRTKLSLISWFVLKNFWSIVPKFFIAMICIWLFFFGGGVIALNFFMDTIGNIAKSNKKPTATQVQQSKSDKKQTSNQSSQTSPGPGQKGGQGTAPDHQSEHIEFINCKNYNVSKFKPENEIIIYAGDVLRTEADFKELKKELEELKRENAKGYMPVYFSDSGNKETILKNGLRIYETYEFSEGQFKGRKVKFVSLKDRYYQLDDDRIIRMHTADQ